MAATSGHQAEFLSSSGADAVAPRDVPFYFLLDRRNGGSVLSYLLSCRQNAENIREHFPPEVWSVLNRLYLEVALYADQAMTENVRLLLEDRSLTTTSSRNSTSSPARSRSTCSNNDAWHFWQLGVYAEPA